MTLVAVLTRGPAPHVLAQHPLCQTCASSGPRAVPDETRAPLAMMTYCTRYGLPGRFLGLTLIARILPCQSAWSHVQVLQGYDHPEAVPEVWLRCLVAGQYFSDRILLDIKAVEYHMEFWKARLKSGNNTLFLALSLGPVKFLEACKALADRIMGKPPRMHLRPTHRIEQRVRSPGPVRKSPAPVHFAPLWFAVGRTLNAVYNRWVSRHICCFAATVAAVMGSTH